jgi:hypothetical protein
MVLGNAVALCEGFVVKGAACAAGRARLNAELIPHEPSNDTFAEDNKASAKGPSLTVSEALLLIRFFA